MHTRNGSKIAKETHFRQNVDWLYVYSITEILKDKHMKVNIPSETKWTQFTSIELTLGSTFSLPFAHSFIKKRNFIKSNNYRIAALPNKQMQSVCQTADKEEIPSVKYYSPVGVSHFAFENRKHMENISREKLNCNAMQIPIDFPFLISIQIICNYLFHGFHGISQSRITYDTLYLCSGNWTFLCCNLVERSVVLRYAIRKYLLEIP